jgi:uncharacterized protein (DUF488 family)
VNEFIGLLSENSIDMLVDVRSFPGSRRCPEFNGDNFPIPLRGYGIAHKHIRNLGGYRGKQNISPTINNGWRNKSFQNYADYALTKSFYDGLLELIGLSKTYRCAIMCCEAVWWRCHRRIITDYLEVSGVEVKHILGKNIVKDAEMTKGAVVQPDGKIFYKGE